LLPDALKQVERISYEELRFGPYSQIAVQYGLHENGLFFEKTLDLLLNSKDINAEGYCVQSLLYYLNQFSPKIIDIIRVKIGQLKSNYLKNLMFLGLEFKDNQKPSDKSIKACLQAARRIKDNPQRAAALCRTMQFLPKEQQTQVSEEVIRILRSLTELDPKVSIILGWKEYMAKESISNLLEETLPHLPQDAVQLLIILPRIASLLDLDKRNKILSDFISLIKRDPKQYLKEGILRYLPKISRNHYHQLIEITNTLTDPLTKAEVLAELSTKLDGSEVDVSVLNAAWKSAQVIGDSKKRLQLFSTLAPNLNRKNLISAMHLMTDDSPPRQQLGYIERLIQFLPSKITDDEFMSVFTLVNSAMERMDTIDVPRTFFSLSVRGSESMLRNVKSQLLKAADKFYDPHSKAALLSNLAPILSLQEFQSILEIYREHKTSIPEQTVRKLGPYLPQELIDEMLEMIFKIEKEPFVDDRSIVLSSLIPYLKENSWPRVLEYLLQQTDNSTDDGVETGDLSGLPLSILYSKLPVDIQSSIQETVLEKIRGIRSFRAEAIAIIFPFIPEPSRFKYLTEAFSFLSMGRYTSFNPRWDTENKQELRLLVPYLAAEYIDWLLEIAEEKDGDFGLSCLYLIAQHLQPDQILRAKEVADKRNDEALYVKLVFCLPDDQKDFAIQELFEKWSLHTHRKSFAVIEVAKFIGKVPEELQRQVSDFIENYFAMSTPDERNILLGSRFWNALCFNHPLGTTLALKLAWKYLEPDDRYRVFIDINDILMRIFDNGLSYPIFSFTSIDLSKEKEKLTEESAEQELNIIENISDEEDRAQSLDRIILDLPDQYHPQVLNIINTISEEQNKYNCLAVLGQVANPELRKKIYDILLSFEIDAFQVEGFRGFVRYLSADELLDALNVARKLDLSSMAYYYISPYLGMWCRSFSQVPANIKNAWLACINPSIPLQRDHLFETLEALQPFTLSLIPGAEPSIANHIYRSILDVITWWP